MDIVIVLSESEEYPRKTPDALLHAPLLSTQDETRSKDLSTEAALPEEEDGVNNTTWSSFPV